MELLVEAGAVLWCEEGEDGNSSPPRDELTHFVC